MDTEEVNLHHHPFTGGEGGEERGSGEGRGRGEMKRGGWGMEGEVGRGGDARRRGEGGEEEGTCNMGA